MAQNAILRFMPAGVAVKKGAGKRQTMYNPGGKRAAALAEPVRPEDAGEHQEARSAASSRQTSISGAGGTVLMSSRARGSSSGSQHQVAADGAEQSTEPAQLPTPAAGVLLGARKPSGKGTATAGTTVPLFFNIYHHNAQKAVWLYSKYPCRLPEICGGHVHCQRIKWHTFYAF